jgi:hypothetical protein
LILLKKTSIKLSTATVGSNGEYHLFFMPGLWSQDRLSYRENGRGSNHKLPFCKLTLNLHGHMWQDVQKEIEKLREKE